MNRQLSSTRSLLLRLLPLLALCACDQNINLEADETLHPTPEDAPPADEAAITTDNEPTGLSVDALNQWRSARDMLLGARVTLALGTDAAEGPELFGMIGPGALARWRGVQFPVPGNMQTYKRSLTKSCLREGF